MVKGLLQEVLSWAQHGGTEFTGIYAAMKAIFI